MNDAGQPTFAANGCRVTSKGIVIGGAYHARRPARSYSADEEAIQRALLAARLRAGLPSRRLEAWVIGLAVVVGLLGSIYFGA